MGMKEQNDSSAYWLECFVPFFGELEFRTLCFLRGGDNDLQHQPLSTTMPIKQRGCDLVHGALGSPFSSFPSGRIRQPPPVLKMVFDDNVNPIRRVIAQCVLESEHHIALDTDPLEIWCLGPRDVT